MRISPKVNLLCAIVCGFLCLWGAGYGYWGFAVYNLFASAVNIVAWDWRRR